VVNRKINEPPRAESSKISNSSLEIVGSGKGALIVEFTLATAQLALIFGNKLLAN
jgi:hypothetical protein